VKKDLKKKYEVISSKVSKKIKNPPLPLKTSTLQQLASSYLGFSASKTMSVAQKLYEGISIKGEHKGLITYMRTDSTRISEEAKEMARNYIIKEYGKEYLGSASPKTKKESKNVQDAHEGVRPTDINLTPQNVMQYLDKDQFKLYNLIWQRFLISQLAAMKYEQFEYILEKDKIQYRGSINKIIFDGYYKVFKEDEDLPIGDFPEIKEGDILVTFDPYHIPIISSHDGKVQYRHFTPKNIRDEKYDVHEYLVVRSVDSTESEPRVHILDKKNEKLATYNIPYGAYMMVRDGAKVKKGDIIAKIIKLGEGTKDITGGLPRVQELFEARNPKGKAILSEIDGRIEILPTKKKQMRVINVRSLTNPDNFKEFFTLDEIFNTLKSKFSFKFFLIIMLLETS